MNKQIELEKLAAEFGAIDVLTIAKDTNEQIAAVMLKNEDPTEEEIVEIMELLRSSLPDNEKIMYVVRTTPLLDQDGPMRPYFFDATSKILAKWINPTERMLGATDLFADAYAKAKFFLGIGSGERLPGLDHIQVRAKIDMLRHIVALTVFAKQMDLSFVSKEHEFSNRLAFCPVQAKLDKELFGLFAKIETCFVDQIKGQDKQQKELADIMFVLIQENKEQICQFAETIKGIIGHNFVKEVFAQVFEKMVELPREERIWVPFNNVRYALEKLDMDDTGALFFAMTTAAIKMGMGFAMNDQAN
ncbi:MAG: hypothetical protein M0R38_12480 [Bacteroidia bacterium]|nr:hypothetical protein [Bacteroidia bacterium]